MTRFANRGAYSRSITADAMQRMAAKQKKAERPAVFIKRSSVPRRVTNGIKVTRLDLVAAQARLEALEAEKAHELSRSKMGCTSCGSVFRIGTATWLIRYWYERPHGCMGGDTWHRADSRETDHVRCPECQHEIYVYNYPNRELLLELRPYFAEQINDRRR